MTKKMVLLVAFVLLAPMFLSSATIGANFKETAISPEEAQQLKPRIYGNLVVWEDYRNDPAEAYSGPGLGNPDIYLYNISSGEEMQICIQKTGDGRRDSAQQNPDIWKNLVVWEDWRNGNADIYIYDLNDPSQAKNGTRLTFNGNNQLNPRVWGNYVVWIDYRNGLDGDVYAFDLSADSDGDGVPNWKESSYGADDAEAALIVVCDSVSEQRDADIYGNTVVWKDYRNDIGNGNRDIYGYDLKNRQEFQICTESHNQFQPVIYGDTVLWVDMRTGTPAIYGKNISTGSEFRLAASGNSQRYPDIWRNTAVWVEDTGSQEVIKLCLLNGSSENLISGGWNQRFPSISSGGIAWSDGRNTGEDMYGRETVQWNVYFLRTSNLAPIIGDITLTPAELQVNKDTDVRISVRIHDPEGDNFTAYMSSKATGDIPLYDDGTHGDSLGGDGIYSTNFSVKAEKTGEIRITVVAKDEYNATSSAEATLKIEKEKNPIYVLIGVFASMVIFAMIMITVYLIRRKTKREIDEKGKEEK